MVCAQMQHDFVDLLSYFISQDDELEEAIELWSMEYTQNYPNTPLREILESMGRKGPVAVEVGAPLGSGVAVLVDNIG